MQYSVVKKRETFASGSSTLPCLCLEVIAISLTNRHFVPRTAASTHHRTILPKLSGTTYLKSSILSELTQCNSTSLIWALFMQLWQLLVVELLWLVKVQETRLSEPSFLWIRLTTTVVRGGRTTQKPVSGFGLRNRRQQMRVKDEK